MKKYITTLLLVVTCFTSCYKDKGNYDYNEPTTIKVEGIPEKIQVIRKRDRIVVTPKLTSSKEGEIKADNPNFTFRYRLGYKGNGFLGGEVDGKGQPWIDLTPTNGFQLDIPADFEEGNFICWFTITDKRNNVPHSHTFEIQVSTLTFQGWMVLSNMGQEERVRLDMISHALATPQVVYDVAEGLPNIHHGTQLSFTPNKSFGDEIALFSKEGSYILNKSTLESDQKSEFNRNTFYTPPAETMLYAHSFVNNANAPAAPAFSFVVSEAGNVYYRRPTWGELFSPRFNTTNVANPQEFFKVAPFVGFSEMRPGNSNVAIFYDQDNKRFMYSTSSVGITKLAVIPIPAGSPNLFPYTTGKDMVYMAGSPRSNGMVQAILQNAQGERSIYGLKMPTGFTTNVIQDYYHENVTAPGFAQATLFAFDPRYPFLFYAVGNKVYRYVLTTRTASEVASITGGEITTLKYNLWRNPSAATLNNQSPEFLNQQYQLIVGTFDPSVANGNGGKVTFYEVDGTTSNVNKLHEYGGFGKLKDVVYRERVK